MTGGPSPSVPAGQNVTKPAVRGTCSPLRAQNRRLRLRDPRKCIDGGGGIHLRIVRRGVKKEKPLQSAETSPNIPPVAVPTGAGRGPGGTSHASSRLRSRERTRNGRDGDVLRQRESP